MKKLVTHSGGFHADDVIAYATLKEVLSRRGETWTLKRSREEGDFNEADIVFDVGGIYDPATNRYDHHQADKAGVRPNGIMYASAGLIWKHFGRELCPNDEVWKAIDKGVLMEIDAIDNGQSYFGELLFKDAGIVGLGMHIANFGPTVFEEHSPEIMMDAFEKASEFARGVLLRSIHAVEGLERAFQEASEVYKNSEDKQILIFDMDYGRPTWKRLAEYPEPIYAVYKNTDGKSWKVEAIPVVPTVYESRKLFPAAWRNLRDQELAEALGVPDAIFCFGFLLGVKSKESAIALAKKALLM